ncbi:MAG: hypothetical protein PHQ74_03795 [Crocinitomicaceae bacterium]|nr:hypothetical protein [Crocinitomicaceae bacterium]
MATYDKEIDYKNSEVYLKLKDRSIYGSSRVGVRSTDIDMLALHNPNYSMKSVKYEIGKRTYELSNHLGNVLSVISDKPIPSFEEGNLTGMLADVRVAQDYSPFGVVLSGRSFEVDGGYRYGFGGHEKDDEVKGAGNYIGFNDYGLDTRLGRRFGNDPVVNPSVSPYSVFLNNPIFFVDPDGESPISILVKMAAKVGLKKAAKEMVESQIQKRLTAYMSKGWAKQLGKDALDAIDLATSQAWWEYAIEVVPWVGDGYSVGKFTKQQIHVWKIVEKFETVASHTSKIAGQAWKKIGFNSNLTGKGKDVLAKHVDNFNNRGLEQLDEATIVGAVKDAFPGVTSGIKVDGSAFNHLKKVENALRGQGKQLQEMKQQIDSGVFEGDALKAAQSAYQEVVGRHNSLKNTLENAKNAAKQFTE